VAKHVMNSLDAKFALLARGVLVRNNHRFGIGIRLEKLAPVTCRVGETEQMPNVGLQLFKKWTSPCSPPLK
jgi:hypothetical protein